MKTILYDYESYEPNSIDVKEGCTLPIMDDEIRSLSKNIITAEENIAIERSKIEDYNSTMEFYRTMGGFYTDYMQRGYNNAKAKAEESERKIAEYEEEMNSAIEQLIPELENFEPEFGGWIADLNYRCKTRGGYPSIGSGMFIIDHKFKEILYYASYDDEYEFELMEIITRYSNY